MGGVGLTSWVMDLCSPDQFEVMVRRFQICYSAGSLVFSVMPGVLADMSGGSYVPAYYIFSSCCLGMVIMIVMLYHKAGKAYLY